MLRRLYAPAAARRCTPMQSAAAVRAICLLSESSPVLLNNASHRGFERNVWVEEEDAYWYKDVTQIKPAEVPTSINKPSRVELYNLDQVLQKPVGNFDGDRHGHFSVKTNKRYSQAFSDQLDQFCVANKLDSKWWMSSAEVRKANLQLQRGARPFVSIFDKPGKFFNAEQFARPSEIQMRGFSGATGRAYSADISAVLRQHAESNGFPNCIYFTERQLAYFGSNIPQGTQGVQLPGTGRSDVTGNYLYPITAVEKQDTFMKLLQRYPVTVPTYIVSGKPLPKEILAKVESVPNPTNYWVSRREVETRGHALIPKAIGVNTLSDEENRNSIIMFNLVQATDYKALFEKIGRFKPE